MVGIYKITSPTEKIYIGQSWDLVNRKSQYKGGYCKTNSPIKSSINKYGWDNHSFEQVHELPQDVTQDVLDSYEIFYWERYRDCGFNMLNAKEPGKGGKHSTVTKQIISAAKIGSRHRKETVDKIRAALKGRSPVTPRRGVEQYTLASTFVKEFDSLTAAASSLGAKTASAICECCQGKRRMYKEYIWKYKVK